MITLADSSERAESTLAKIKVVGVGGCGCNSVKMMALKGVPLNVELIALNTDAQSLDGIDSELGIKKIYVGSKKLGAGAKPEIGQKVVEEARAKIEEVLSGADLVFVTAGLGKGTGTGGAPVVANIAKSLGALVIAVVFTPFRNQGKRALQIAEEGLKNLKEVSDTVLAISNEKLLNSVGKYDIQEAFDFGNEVLYNAVKGITDIISKPGLVNVDFMDVKTVMSDTGNALLGTGIARGEHRAIEATQKAISHPLVEGVSIDGAKNVLINIVAGKLSLTEVDEAIKVITDRTGDDINLIYGVVKDETMGEDFMVTVIATGIDTVSVSPKKTPPMPRRVTPVYDIDDEGINYKETETKRPAYLRRGVVIENKGEVSDFDNKKTLEGKPPFLRNVMD